MSERTSAAIRHRNGRVNVWLKPSRGQTPEQVQEDIDRSVSFIERLVDRGVQSWWAKYQRVGPFKVGVTKEVGPPPWPWPKAYARAHRSPVTLSAGAGWRSTAFTVHLLWAPESGEASP